jgi:hypothetical protein
MIVTLVFRLPAKVRLLHWPMPMGSISLCATLELQLLMADVRVPPFRQSEEGSNSIDEKEVIVYFHTLHCHCEKSAQSYCCPQSKLVYANL